jgi:serine/threonine protein kinase
MSDLPTELSGPILELGGFRLLSVLGEGSFATAYLAQQIGTERKAVLKVAHPHLIRGPYGDMIRQRFDAEVRAITRIQHPNMVTVYTSGLTPQSIPYIAMELVQGHTLDYRLQHAAPLRRDVVLTLFEQVASVLKSAHSMGVVHRDITPNNIMIQEDEQGRPVARVLDFGIAMLDEKHSHTVGPIGTPRYLAPEQLNGRAVAQSDIFSLGAVMWWAITGREYLDQAGSIFDIFRIYNHEGVPNDPRKLRADVDPQLSKLVTTMLLANPNDRPDAAAVQAHLQRLRDEGTPGKLIRPLTPITGTPRLDFSRDRLKTSSPGLGLETSEPLSVEDEQTLQNLQIIILNTDPSSHEVMVRSLERCGAEVLKADDVDDIIAITEQFVPDVLLIRGPTAQLELHNIIRHATQKKSNPPLTILITDRIPTGALPDELVVVTSRDAAQLPGLIHRYLNKPERILRNKLQNTEGLDLARVHHLHVNHPQWLARALDQVVEHVPKLLSQLEEALDTSDLRRATLCAEQLERASREVGLSGLTQRTNDLLRELLPLRLHIARERHAKVISAYMAVFPTILKLRSLLPRA